MPPPDDQIHPAAAVWPAGIAEPGFELGVFRRFAVEMIAIRSEDALLWHVARNVVGQMDFSECVIYRSDAARHVLRQAAAMDGRAAPGRPDMITNPLTIPIGDGIAGAVARSRVPLIIDDLRNDPRHIPDLSEARSQICVPILNGAELLGIIDCRHPAPHRFGPADLDILTAIAALTAAQILQCRLIRDSRETQRKLTDALELCEQAQLSQQRFLANASHELRTPLNSIVGFASLLSRPGYFAENPERGEEQVATIMAAGQNLASIINDILEIRAAAGGQLMSAPECLDIPWEVEEATSPYRRRREQPEILIETIGDADSLQAWCDIRHLHKILARLTEHAVSASAPDCPVTVRITRDGDQVEVTVANQGFAIPAESVDTAFTPFSQEPSSSWPGLKRGGLGLTLARELAQANLGEVSLVSQPGEGSAFTLRLPAFIETDAPDQDEDG